MASPFSSEAHISAAFLEPSAAIVWIRLSFRRPKKLRLVALPAGNKRPSFSRPSAARKYFSPIAPLASHPEAFTETDILAVPDEDLPGGAPPGAPPSGSPPAQTPGAQPPKP